MEATARAVVPRPIDAVWALVSSVERMEEWVDGVGDVRRGDDGDLVVGSTFESKYTYRGETFDVEYEVTRHDPPHRLDIRWTAGPFPFAGSIRLVEAAGGTEVSNTVDAGSDSLATSVIFTVFGPLIRRLMRRRLAGELDHLATAVESADDRSGRPVEADA